MLMTNKELCEKYPFLLNVFDDCGKVIPASKRDYTDNWWESIPFGWRKAFGLEMCEELLTILREFNHVEDFYFIQIKEKFGSLRLYFLDKSFSKEMLEKIQKWADKYMELSENTCVVCGEKATKKDKRYVVPLCSLCYKRKLEVNNV